jgi:hypothetical protein
MTTRERVATLVSSLGANRVMWMCDRFTPERTASELAPRWSVGRWFTGGMHLIRLAFTSDRICCSPRCGPRGAIAPHPWRYLSITVIEFIRNDALIPDGRRSRDRVWRLDLSGSRAWTHRRSLGRSFACGNAGVRLMHMRLWAAVALYGDGLLWFGEGQSRPEPAGCGHAAHPPKAGG